jgi:hypothetical protein
MFTTQLPAWQDAWSHRLPSLHGVSSGATGFAQWPVVGSQVPARWQASVFGHVTVVPARQPNAPAHAAAHSVPPELGLKSWFVPGVQPDGPTTTVPPSAPASAVPAEAAPAQFWFVVSNTQAEAVGPVAFSTLTRSQLNPSGPLNGSRLTVKVSLHPLSATRTFGSVIRKLSTAAHPVGRSTGTTMGALPFTVSRKSKRPVCCSPPTSTAKRTLSAAGEQFGRQVSADVQALPSSHAAPSAFCGFEQIPVVGSQLPALWHVSDAVHTTGFEPTQVPAWHVFVCMQRLLPAHAAPSGLFGFEHLPVVGSQVPAM